MDPRAVLALILLAGAACGADAPADFHRHIKPILESSCVRCHGSDRAEADIRIDTPAFAGEFIEPGRSADSALYTVLVLPDDHRKAMPIRDRDRLSAQQIALVRAWIDAGAPWPDGEVLTRVDKATFTVVGPILQRDCVACHRQGDARGGLRLDRRDLALQGGGSGPAIVAFDAAASRLHRVLIDPRPHHRPKFLDPDEIATIGTWIDQGAVWPEDAADLAP